MLGVKLIFPEPAVFSHLRLEEGVSARARGGAGSVLELETNLHEVFTRQSQKMPLQGPSPGWKNLQVLKTLLRHYAKEVLTHNK